MFKRTDTITDTIYAEKFLRSTQPIIPNRVTIRISPQVDGSILVDSVPYQAGDFALVRGGFMSILSARIFTPATRLYHTLIIGQYIPDEDDYIIYEALASGIRTGRLSWYSACTYIVYRLNDPQSELLGRIAANEATRFGRWGYDFGMYFRIAKDLVGLWAKQLLLEHHIRRVEASELTYRENGSLVCTEFVNTAYKPTRRPIVPAGTCPIPSAFVDAIMDKKLISVGSNNITDKEI